MKPRARGVAGRTIVLCGAAVLVLLVSGLMYRSVLTSMRQDSEDSVENIDTLAGRDQTTLATSNTELKSTMTSIVDGLDLGTGSYGGLSRIGSTEAKLVSTEETYAYFENILVIMMLSPSRYHLVKNVRDHYAPFFKHMTFCGPKTADLHGIHVQGYDIVYGNEQYRAVARIIRDYVVNKSAVFEGVLYIGDDVLLQPWSIAAKKFNKNIPWATQMGIANLNIPRPVAAVPGMSVQSKYRAQWPYWAKNRKKLMGVLEEGGPKFREAMFKAAKATHPLIYKWSKYSSKAISDEALHNVIFYTIVDTYYIPWRLAMQYAEVCDLMAKHWIFGECAIATSIRFLSPIYEQMDIQFYWSTLKAEDCHRYRWHVMVDGFHRCRHDHKFSHLIYQSDLTREALKANRTFLAAALALNGLDPVPVAD